MGHLFLTPEAFPSYTPPTSGEGTRMNEPNFQQMQKDRVRRLQEVMKEQDFGALLLTEGPQSQ